MDELLAQLAITFMGTGVLMMPVAYYLRESSRGKIAEAAMYGAFGSCVVIAMIAVWLP